MIALSLQVNFRKKKYDDGGYKRCDLESWGCHWRGPLFISLTGKDVVVAILGFILQLQGTVLGLTRADNLQVLYGKEKRRLHSVEPNKQSWAGVTSDITSCGLLVLSLLLTLIRLFMENQQNVAGSAGNRCWTRRPKDKQCCFTV